MKNDIGPCGEDTMQTKRISEMEQLLDNAQAALDALEAALDGFEAARPGLRELAAYYDGGDWRRDFEADEMGLLQDGLKRGVLSEDALYDLLAAQQALRERMLALAGNGREN